MYMYMYVRRCSNGVRGSVCSCFHVSITHRHMTAGVGKQSVDFFPLYGHLDSLLCGGCPRTPFESVLN